MKSFLMVFITILSTTNIVNAQIQLITPESMDLLYNDMPLSIRDLSGVPELSWVDTEVNNETVCTCNAKSEISHPPIYIANDKIDRSSLNLIPDQTIENENDVEEIDRSFIGRLMSRFIGEPEPESETEQLVTQCSPFVKVSSRGTSHASECGLRSINNLFFYMEVGFTFDQDRNNAYRPIYSGNLVVLPDGREVTMMWIQGVQPNTRRIHVNFEDSKGDFQSMITSYEDLPRLGYDVSFEYLLSLVLLH